jgi:hypothetical protein
MRPPTPDFGLGASEPLDSFGVALGSYSLPTSSSCATSVLSPAGTRDAGSSCIRRDAGESRRDRVEQLDDDLAVQDVTRDETTRVKQTTIRVAARDAALGDGDEPFDEWTQFLGLGTVVSMCSYRISASAWLRSIAIR